MKTNGLLCLDLGSVVGWAYGHVGDLMPAFGTWHLANTTLHGPRYVSYENELIAALELHRPKLCVMEAPLHLGGHKGNNAARLQLGLAAYTEGECARARVQLREQEASTARKAVLGRGTFPTGTAKDHILAWCARQGWPVPDHNAGDACVLWRYSCILQAERAGTGNAALRGLDV